MSEPTKEQILQWCEAAWKMPASELLGADYVARIAYAAGRRAGIEESASLLTADAKPILSRAAYLLRDAAFSREEGRRLAAQLHKLAAAISIVVDAYK